MMFLPRADLFVLLRIGKTKAFYFFRAGPVHAYLRTAFSPAHPCQILFTLPALRLLRNRFPVTCHTPRRGASGMGAD
jgi:hypothetical protein